MISIIIPTYNRGELLKRAVFSVMNQSYKNFELLIVDDGSIDDTKRIIEEFIVVDKRIKYHKKNNSGPAATRNLGIKKAEGDCIAFLDSDDEWLPNKLEKQYHYLKNNKNIDFVGCGVVDVVRGFEKKNNISYYHFREVLKNLLNEELLHSAINSSNLLIKSEIFDKIGFFDEKFFLNEDYDMWLRIAKDYNFGFIDEVLVKCHKHSDNATGLASLQKKIRYKEMLIKKQESSYLKYPAVYSEVLRKIATTYLKINNIAKAKRYLCNSIKVHPSGFRSYINLIIFMISKSLYLYIEKRKRS